MFARFIYTLPFQQAVGSVCWINHTHDDAPQNRSLFPSPVNVNPNHSPSYHSPTPDFTPISTPPLSPSLAHPPIWLHMTNNSEDDTQVLDFAVRVTQCSVTFFLSLFQHKYAARPLQWRLRSKRIWIPFLTYDVNFFARQINIVGKRRAAVMSLFNGWSKGKRSRTILLLATPCCEWLSAGTESANRVTELDVLTWHASQSETVTRLPTSRDRMRRIL